MSPVTGGVVPEALEVVVSVEPVVPLAAPLVSVEVVPDDPVVELFPAEVVPESPVGGVTGSVLSV